MNTKKTTVIAIGNQKGGVGKTTNCIHIAAALGELGKKVLIIDLDMNHGATRHFRIPPNAFLGSFEILVGDEDPIDVTITEDDEILDENEEKILLPENVDIIPAKRRLEEIDQALAAKSKFKIAQNILKKPLERLAGRYDFILLDTAPNATTPTIAAYNSAEWFILSAMPDPFAISGLRDALSDIEDAQNEGNPNLRLLGVILAGADKRTTLANQLIDYVEEAFNIGNGISLKFETIISRSTVIPTTQNLGQTTFQTHPNHKVTEQYRRLASEIIDRLSLEDKISDERRMGNG